MKPLGFSHPIVIKKNPLYVISYGEKIDKLVLIKLNSIDSSNKLKYELDFSRGIEIVAKRVLDPLLHIDWIWNLTDARRRLREYSRFGHELFGKVFIQIWIGF